MLSEQMLIARAGNFTASENHRLMCGWDNPVVNRSYPEFDAMHRVMKGIIDKDCSKPLVRDIQDLVDFKVTGELINKSWAYIQSQKIPEGLITYAEEKAMETLFEPDPSLSFRTVHTKNGEDREVECMQILSERTGLQFINTGDNQTHIHANEIGCTPDGIVLDELDLVKTGAEVKCKSPLVHAKNLLINNNDDLKEMAFDHFVQIQTAMLVTSTDYWHFANYNPFAKSDDLMFKFIVINRDNEFIKKLCQRIEIAKNIKSNFLEKIANSIAENNTVVPVNSKLSIEV